LQVLHPAERFEQRAERGVDFYAARYVGPSCASMCHGVHMEAHRAHNKAKTQLCGKKVLRSRLAIAPSLRSAVMLPSIVITNHELIERHSSVASWEYLFHFS
jgi:hypothetical protein